MSERWLADLSAAVPDVDAEAHEAALRRWGDLASPPGSLGRLEALGAWVCATQRRCPPESVRDVRAVVFAGDHGIAHAGVSAHSSSATAAMVRAMAGGRAAVNALAGDLQLTVQVLDISVDADLDDLGPSVTRFKVRRGSGSIDREDAMTADEARQAFGNGQRVADDAVDSGAQVLVAGALGVGHTTPASALVALLTRSEVVDVVGRGSGLDDVGWMRKAAAIRDAAHRGRGRVADPLDLLAAIGGADLAALAGFLTQAVIRRTPVILDGLLSATAALITQKVSFRAPRWMLAAHLSSEPAHAKALGRLGLHPVLDLGLNTDDGTGALMAVPLVRSAAALLAALPTLDEVNGGVSDKG